MTISTGSSRNEVLCSGNKFVLLLLQPIIVWLKLFCKYVNILFRPGNVAFMTPSLTRKDPDVWEVGKQVTVSSSSLPSSYLTLEVLGYQV